MKPARRPAPLLLSPIWLVLAFAAAMCLPGCGGSAGRPGPESEPLVPGYSAAGIGIGDDYASVRALYGEPEDMQTQEGYLTLFYQPTGRYADLVPCDGRPAAWHLVVILNDEARDGLAGDADTVAGVEVAQPYTGRTAGGVGLASGQPAVEQEFGPPEQTSVVKTVNPDAAVTTLFYPGRGVCFLVADNGGVLAVIITAIGGLQPQVLSSNDGTANPGGVDGPAFSGPIVPGKELAGISMGSCYHSVRELYGSPDAQGSSPDGYVTAAYTGGAGHWQLYVYFEDLDRDGKLGDYDTVISINVTAPYGGKTAKGTGIGAKRAVVEREFGAPPMKYSNARMGVDRQVWEYPDRGIVLAFDTAADAVVEIDVNRIP